MKAEAIVYTSNTGFTADYAARLSRATGLLAYEQNKAPAQLGPVVYLGWLCAGGIKGLRQAQKRWTVAAVCAVGMGKPGENDLDSIARANHTGDRPLFYLQGGYDGKRLTGIYKWMMWAMGKVMDKKAASDPNAADMVRAMKNGANWVSDEQLAPVLNWLNH